MAKKKSNGRRRRGGKGPQEVIGAPGPDAVTEARLMQAQEQREAAAARQQTPSATAVPPSLMPEGFEGPPARAPKDRSGETIEGSLNRIISGGGQQGKGPAPEGRPPGQMGPQGRPPGPMGPHGFTREEIPSPELPLDPAKVAAGKANFERRERERQPVIGAITKDGVRHEMRRPMRRGQSPAPAPTYEERLAKTDALRKSRGMDTMSERIEGRKQRRTEDEASARARREADREGRYTTTGKPWTSIKRIYEHEAPDQYKAAVESKQAIQDEKDLNRRARDAGIPPHVLRSQDVENEKIAADAARIKAETGQDIKLQGMRDKSALDLAAMQSGTARGMQTEQLDVQKRLAEGGWGHAEAMQLLQNTGAKDLKQMDIDQSTEALKANTDYQNALLAIQRGELDLKEQAHMLAAALADKQGKLNPANMLAAAQELIASGEFNQIEVIELFGMISSLEEMSKEPDKDARNTGPLDDEAKARMDAAIESRDLSTGLY